MLCGRKQAELSRYSVAVTSACNQTLRICRVGPFSDEKGGFCSLVFFWGGFSPWCAGAEQTQGSP